MKTGDMREYAQDQVLRLLRRMVSELHRSPNAPGSEAIHDLRVSVRRFLQVSRLFRQFLPAKELKRIRKKLRRLLDVTAEVRERDITLEFFDELRISPDAAPRQRLIAERRKAQRRLARLLNKWSRKEVAINWRSGLELS